MVPRPVHTQCHWFILGATHTMTALGIYWPIFTPTTIPATLVHTKELLFNVLHHIPSNGMCDFKWWSCTLAIPNPSCSLNILHILPLDVWVDASTSLGVGLLVDSHWAVWRLLNGWHSDG